MSKNKGFTLIELIIAIMVFSVVMAAGYGVLHFVNTTIKDQVQAANTRKLVRNIVEQITKDIQESTSVSGDSFIEPSGDIIRYCYDDSSKELIRQLNGIKNIEYKRITQPFSIEETATNLFTVTLTTIDGKRVTETQQFNVARETGENIDITNPTEPGDTINLKFALLTPGDINMSGSSFINGDAGTKNGKLTMSSASINGKVYTGQQPVLDIKNSTITGGQPIVDPSIQYTYSMPEIKDAPSIQNRVKGSTKFGWYPLKSPITESTDFDNLEIDNYMEVDVSHGDIIIHTKSLKITGGSQKGNDKIVLNGSGKLFLYVDNVLTINGAGYINRDNSADKLSLILKNGSLDLNGSCQANINAYLKKGNLTVSGSAALTGSCIAGGNKVDISGGGVAMNGAILAPSATFSLTGSRIINGWVIAGGKSILQGGGTSINYTPIQLKIP